jgi:hypothetical protein
VKETKNNLLQENGGSQGFNARMSELKVQGDVDKKTRWAYARSTERMLYKEPCTVLDFVRTDLFWPENMRSNTC